MVFRLNQTHRAELAFPGFVARKTHQPCLQDTVSWIKDTYAFAKFERDRVFSALIF